MLQSIGDVREGFICPECRQDMSTIEMLHVHFEDVHMKQSSTTVKGISIAYFNRNFSFYSGLFSLAKQKIKSVQDNFTTIPTEQPNNYSQFFSFDQNSASSKSQQQQFGYIRSHDDKFKKLRKEKHDQTSMETIRLLLRLVQLTSNEEHVPKNVNTKERRSISLSIKYKENFVVLEFEQDIVQWIDESKVSLCPSCAKTFGLSRRKHHCRLDGFVVCSQCSQFLPFSIARKIHSKL
jgi:rabenosyn-5